MARHFLAGVADVDIFVGDKLIATANTLLDSSITLGSSGEDVRGGSGAKLLGKYFHTSTFDVALTDVLFKLDYFAFQTGSQIETMAEVFTSESVEIKSNKGTIKGTPIDFGQYGLVGWATVPGSDEHKTITFTAGRSTNQTFAYNAPDGTKVCVKYISKENAARSITISSNFIPSEVHLVMTANLYRAGAGAKAGDLTGSSRVGTIQVDVPRFLFSGATELSMSATGVANSPINGSALDNPSNDCSGSGYYAVITENLFGAKWYDDVFALAVDDAAIEIPASEHYQMTVYALTPNGVPFVPPVADLTFNHSGEGVASVEAGDITAGSTGSGTVTVTITNKPTIGASAAVTVTV